MKEGRILGVFFPVFCEKKTLFISLNGASFLHVVLDNSRKKAQIPYEMRVPTAFAAKLFFHAMALIKNESGRKS